jgi:hypothetical protein
MKLIKKYSSGFFKFGSNSDAEIKQAAELSEIIKEISGFSYMDYSATNVFRHLIEICNMGDIDPLFEWQELCDHLIILLGNLKPNEIGVSINIPMAQAQLSILKSFFADVYDNREIINLLRFQALNLLPDCADIQSIALNYYRHLINNYRYGDRNTPLREIINRIKVWRQGNNKRTS